MASQPVVLMITVEGDPYGPHKVTLNGQLIEWRTYSGARHDEIYREATRALATMLSERLNYSTSDPAEDEDYL